MSITGPGSGKLKVLCNSCVVVKESQDSSTEVVDFSDRYGCTHIQFSADAKFWYQFFGKLMSVLVILFMLLKIKSSRFV